MKKKKKNRWLKRKQHRTGGNVYHNGLINRVFMCRRVVTTYAQR